MATNKAPATAKPSICVVTGANGFVAQHVISQLLEAGHTVRGTVRNPDDDKHQFLFSIDGAKDRLTLHAADLQTDGAFDDVVQDAKFVFHIASPYKMDYQDGEEELVKPAVAGALSVLQSVHARADAGAGVRTVLTSSIAAMLDRPENGVTVDESSWNTTFKSGDYYKSKTAAERAAWDYAEKNGLDLVVINPFMVIGPTFADQHNTSTDILINLCKGQFPVIPPLKWGFVDVRDVARAHLQAAFNEKASGRHLVSTDVLSAKQLVELLRTQFPQYANKLPSISLDCKLGAFLTRLSAISEKSKGTKAFLRTQAVTDDLTLDNRKSIQELDLNYLPLKDAVVDSINNSIKWGHL